MSELPEFLTVEEAAALLRIGRTSAYTLAKEWRDTGGRRGLPVITLGRQLRVPRAALDGLHEGMPTQEVQDDLPKQERLEGETLRPSWRRRSS